MADNEESDHIRSSSVIKWSSGVLAAILLSSASWVFSSISETKKEIAEMKAGNAERRIALDERLSRFEAAQDKVAESVAKILELINRGRHDR